MNKIELTISEAAKELKIETHVLRYWEEELGIHIPRNEMGHRIYRNKEMHLFHNIIELKHHGFQLRAIKLLLADLKEGEELNLNKLIEMREEINRRVEFLNSEGIEVEESVPELIRKTLIKKQLLNTKNVYSFPQQHNLVDYDKNDAAIDTLESSKPRQISNERVQQFQYIMLQIMNQSLNEYTAKMTQTLKNELAEEISGRLADQLASSLKPDLSSHISDEVSTRIIKELNYLSRMQEEAQEEHFQRLDEKIREYQKPEKAKRFFGKDKQKNKKDLKLVAAAKNS